MAAPATVATALTLSSAGLLATSTSAASSLLNSSDCAIWIVPTLDVAGAGATILYDEAWSLKPSGTRLAVSPVSTSVLPP